MKLNKPQPPSLIPTTPTSQKKKKIPTTPQIIPCLCLHQSPSPNECVCIHTHTTNIQTYMLAQPTYKHICWYYIAEITHSINYYTLSSIGKYVKQKEQSECPLKTNSSTQQTIRFGQVQLVILAGSCHEAPFSPHGLLLQEKPIWVL